MQSKERVDVLGTAEPVPQNVGRSCATARVGGVCPRLKPLALQSKSQLTGSMFVQAW